MSNLDLECEALWVMLLFTTFSGQYYRSYLSVHCSFSSAIVYVLFGVCLRVNEIFSSYLFSTVFWILTFCILFLSWSFCGQRKRLT